MTCTFFGHRKVPQEIEPALRSTLIDLIENHDVNAFYVGNNGEFDAMVLRQLRDLSKTYSITYSVVIAYMPEKQREFDTIDYSETILPDCIETVPKRFAIDFRNRWMIKQSDYVVTYVTNDIGSGAGKYKQRAVRKGKMVIELISYRYNCSKNNI